MKSYTLRVPASGARGLAGSPTGEPRTLTDSLFVANYRLSRGQCGLAIGAWQGLFNVGSALSGLGITLKIDGTFGSDTESATRELQRALRVKVDGVVGSKTLGALRALLERMDWRIVPGPTLPAPTSCTARPGGASSGGASSGGSTSPEAPYTPAPPSQDPLGLASLDLEGIIGEYGTVIAVGLGLAAFALLTKGNKR